MSWIEVIHLRSIQSKYPLIKDYLKSLTEEINGKKNTMRIDTFSRCNLKIDHCLHLHHSSERVMKRGSKLGNHLVDELRQYGLVNHSVWRKYKG